MTTARSLLQDLAIELQKELKSNASWLEDGYAFGADPFADYRDAEFHLRALWRLLVVNRPTDPAAPR